MLGWLQPRLELRSGGLRAAQGGRRTGLSLWGQLVAVLSLCGQPKAVARAGEEAGRKRKFLYLLIQYSPLYPLLMLLLSLLYLQGTHPH
jgi:hypothetical protein